MKFKIGILILLLCQIAQAQQSEMSVNKNQYNSDFTASSKLKEQFRILGKSNNEFKLILKSNDSENISVFVQNNTTEIISLLHQDNQIYILQEAMDKNGLWKPIEYWESSDCGNSFGQINIESKGIIETKSTKYQGSFKTKIRFKLSTDEKLFYSNTLDGSINPNKLIMPNDFSFLWPLVLMGKKTPLEIQKKVVFLEPNGVKEFNAYSTKSHSKK
jgi:hypothetical protein